MNKGRDAVNDALHNDSFATGHAARKARDWRKAMSDNVALALLVYTALQIFMTVGAMKQGVSSIVPYLALCVLVVGIIPACRWFERRWSGLTDEQATEIERKPAFRRDQILLWVLAIGLPVALTAFFKLIFS